VYLQFLLFIMTTKSIAIIAGIVAVLALVGGFAIFSSQSANNTQNQAVQNSSRRFTEIVNSLPPEVATQMRNKSSQKAENSAIKSSKIAQSTVAATKPADKVVDTGSETIKISAAELSSANSSEKCYVAFKGQVYDITTFLSMHPGGASKPEKQCGKVIDSFSDVHPGGDFDSPQAKAMLQTRMIGNLE
jgi:cytochrome b involved in lipid metabolism